MTVNWSPDQQEDRLCSLSWAHERIMIISMDTYEALIEEGGNFFILKERGTGTSDFIQLMLDWKKMWDKHKERVVTSPIIPTFLPNWEMLSPE